jgi:hypothetical protein
MEPAFRVSHELCKWILEFPESSLGDMKLKYIEKGASARNAGQQAMQPPCSQLFELAMSYANGFWSFQNLL